MIDPLEISKAMHPSATGGYVVGVIFSNGDRQVFRSTDPVSCRRIANAYAEQWLGLTSSRKIVGWHPLPNEWKDITP